MKKVFAAVLLFGLVLTPLCASAQALPGLDKSPVDITYFRKSRADKPLAKVIYSRPQKNERPIFGNLVPYGGVWRAGANEATEIDFFQDGSFGGKPIKAGRYSLYAIPGEKTWTLILNSALDEWGAYTYDKSKDVVRVEAAVSESAGPVEAFTMQFIGAPPSGKLVFAWDRVWIEVPVSF